MAKKPTQAVATENEDEPEGVSSLAAQRLGIIASSAPLQSGTLAGDVRDTLLDLFKTRPKTWGQMTEAEQSDIGRALEYAARELVKGAVDVIRADGVESPVKAILEGFADKGDVKASLKVKTGDEDDANRTILSLHKWRGKLVLVTLASADDYMGESRGFEPAPDQAGLEFEAEKQPDWQAIGDQIAKEDAAAEDEESEFVEADDD